MGKIKKQKSSVISPDNEDISNIDDNLLAKSYCAGSLSELFGKPASQKEKDVPIIIGDKKIETTIVKSVSNDASTREMQRKNRKEKGKNMTSEERNRTIFVGNIPVNIDEKAVKKLFSKFGKIESVRVRGIVPTKETLTKRVAHITQEYSDKQTSLIYYVKFLHEDSVAEALTMNGELVDGHRIRVDTTTKTAYDKDYTVFVGNLPFSANEEQISGYFEKEVGPVVFSRLIKDNSTGKGRGIAFVVFKDTSSVDLALNMSGCDYEGRQLRIMKTMKKNQIAKHIEAAKKHKNSGKTTSNKPSKIDKYKFSTKKQRLDENQRLKKTAKKAIAKKKTVNMKKSLMS